MDNKETKKDLKVFVSIGAIGAIILVLAIPFIGAGVFSILWGWFMVTLFHLPKLSLIQSLGALMIWDFLAYRGNFYSIKQKDSWQTTLASAYLSLAIFLVLGWLIHLFI